MDTPAEKFEMWARVDLFGHNQRAGKLSVVNTGVEVLYRLDTPSPEEGFTTEFFGKGAVYSIIPVSEDAARLIASKLGATEPISHWDLPPAWREAMQIAKAKALPAPASDAPDTGRDDFDDSDNEDEDTGDEDDEI